MVYVSDEHVQTESHSMIMQHAPKHVLVVCIHDHTSIPEIYTNTFTLTPKFSINSYISYKTIYTVGDTVSEQIILG